MASRLLIDFNPGILSTIAVAFRQRMLENESKRKESASYGLEFPVTFTGKEAVVCFVLSFVLFFYRCFKQYRVLTFGGIGHALTSITRRALLTPLLSIF
jgi:hypothetical protein